MKISLLLGAVLAVVVAISACTTCGPEVSAPYSVCVEHDGGLNAIEGSTSATCAVSLDAGTLSFNVTQQVCSTFGKPANEIALLALVPCDLSAVPAGNYQITTGGKTGTFAVPAIADGGLDTCPR